MTYQAIERNAPRGLRKTVAPTLQLVDLPTLKMHGRIDSDEEDLLLLEYIDAASDYAESYQERCWRLSTFQAVYDCFPCETFYLPLPPLVAVTSITYLDTSGVSQTLATSVYTVDAISEPGRVSLAYGQQWPTTLSQQGAVTITYTAGKSAVADVPARTRHAIRVLASHWFKVREPIVAGETVATVPYSVEEMLEQDRLVSYR